MKNEEVVKFLDIGRKITPMSKVNLDAFIPKADFIFNESVQGKATTIELNIQRLSPKGINNPHSIVHLLKKPDFQRETSEWDKKRIADLIEAFYTGSFIPAIILWRNEVSGNIYVIDGAHRLSALMAYINDDYGDKEITSAFYEYSTIPKAQLDIAFETRNYINEKIGAYKDVIMSTSGTLKRIADGLNLGSLAHQTINADLERAEDSFFKINQQGVVLSPTENKLCRGRKKPSCLATRIVMKGDSGSQYWANFKAENQKLAKEFGAEIHNLLFLPPYDKESHSIVLHHPLAGDITNALAMIYELLKIIKTGKETEDVLNGAQTIEYLIAIRKKMWIMLSSLPGSLVMVPSIYFYTSSGAYLQGAFLGFVALLKEREDSKDYLITFTMGRSKLEEFLIKHKVFLTQINTRFGSRERSFRHFKGFYSHLIDYFENNSDETELISQLKKKWDFLNESEADYEKSKSSAFSKEQKRYFRISEDISLLPKCGICNGYIHPVYRSYDHKDKQGNNGGNESSNAQPTHTYCNNSRDKLESIGFYKP